MYGLTQFAILLATVFDQNSYDRWISCLGDSLRCRAFMWRNSVIDVTNVIGTVDRHVVGIIGVRDIKSPIRATD